MKFSIPARLKYGTLFSPGAVCTAKIQRCFLADKPANIFYAFLFPVRNSKAMKNCLVKFFNSIFVSMRTFAAIVATIRTNPAEHINAFDDFYCVTTVRYKKLIYDSSELFEFFAAIQHIEFQESLTKQMVWPQPFYFFHISSKIYQEQPHIFCLFL